jgi:hypothetical protein
MSDYEDTVTIVVPRKAAEDLYYAIALAMGGRFGYGDVEWGGGKKGRKSGYGAGGKGPGKVGAPKPKS